MHDHPLATASHVANQQWLVILPDAPNATPTRLAHHTPHFESAKPDVASGFFAVAGKIYDAPFAIDEEHRIAGTFLVVRARTKEEVLERLRRDLFYVHGVWEWDRLMMWPCKSTFSGGKGGEGEGL